MLHTQFIYNNLLTKIAQFYPTILASSLNATWLDKVKEITTKPLNSKFTNDEILNEKIDIVKLYKSHENILHLIKHINEIELRLNSLFVPVQKIEIHKQIIYVYSNQRELQEQLLNYAKNKEYDKMRTTLNTIENYRIDKINPFLEKLFLSEN